MDTISQMGLQLLKWFEKFANGFEKIASGFEKIR